VTRCRLDALASRIGSATQWRVAVTPVIDRRYRLSEVPAAIRYLEEGHARGKVVISME
jgi:NADPH:quinone reductase-like Zn-dependent oxidoreductase